MPAPPALRDASAHPLRAAPMIYFIAPDVARPSGGVRTIYRSVDLLNAAGRPRPCSTRGRASAANGSTTRRAVVYPPVRVGAADVLVVPAYFLAELPTIAPGVRKVVFNQNAYRTFRSSPGRSGPVGVQSDGRDVTSSACWWSPRTTSVISSTRFPTWRSHAFTTGSIRTSSTSIPRRSAGRSPRCRGSAGTISSRCRRSSQHGRR